MNYLPSEAWSILAEVRRSEVSDPNGNAWTLYTTSTDYNTAAEWLLSEKTALRGGLAYRDRNGFDTLGLSTVTFGAGFFVGERHTLDLALAYFMGSGESHIGNNDSIATTGRSEKSEISGVVAGAQYQIHF